MKKIILLLIVLLVFGSSAYPVLSDVCDTYCQEQCDKDPQCKEATGTQIGNQCSCTTVNKPKLPNLTIQLIIIGAVLAVFAIILTHSKNLSKSIHVGMVTTGVLVLIAGFILVFSIIPLGLLQEDEISIYQGYNLCNKSVIGELAMLFSPDEFLESCSMVNMLFFLGILITIVGIILLIVGLVKKG
jgi:hypothetical protein